MHCNTQKLLIGSLGVLFLILMAGNSIVIPVTGGTLVWHSSLRKGTLLGYKVVDLNVGVGYTPQLGDNVLSLNDIIQIKLIDNLPMNPESLYNELAFAEYYLNGVCLDLNESSSGVGFAIVILMPLEYQLDNGSALDTVNFMLFSYGEGVYSKIQGNYFVTYLEIGDEEVFALNHKTTGILYQFYLRPKHTSYYIRLGYSSEASNVDVAGNSDNGTTNPVSGFGIISFFGMVGTVLLIRTLYRSKSRKSSSFK
ncbi:MAG: hypothetical protein ACFFBD_04910 [Candidatus Hodarchaeota archaeon]